MFPLFVHLRHALVACLLALTATAAPADDFVAPAGEVILTMSGLITATNAQGTLMLDQTQLAALPQHGFTTATPWTEGKIGFQGVLMKDLIAAIGASGGTITLTALNDYRITMPMADVRDDGPLLAYLMDDKPMSLRDKGPIWLVFPYDDNANYRTEQSYARSIWQLDRIEFGP
jgi:hypothetical protein